MYSFGLFLHIRLTVRWLLLAATTVDKPYTFPFFPLQLDNRVRILSFNSKTSIPKSYTMLIETFKAKYGRVSHKGVEVRLPGSLNLTVDSSTNKFKRLRYPCVKCCRRLHV